MDTLVALCDIFDCAPNDLIKPVVVNQQLRKTSDGATGSTGGSAPMPRRSVVRRPGQR
jgi:hypothetical protein